jgi:hypothetical protein
MKTIINVCILIFLLLTPHTRCHAMISVEDVSAKRAKELGVTFRMTRNGEAGIQVRMEFKAEGELKKVTYVQVQIGEGEERIMSAQLPISNPTPETGAVSFSAYPDYLLKSSLMIVVYNGPKGDVGYRFKVKDFIESQRL